MCAFEYVRLATIVSQYKSFKFCLFWENFGTFLYLKIKFGWLIANQTWLLIDRSSDALTTPKAIGADYVTDYKDIMAKVSKKIVKIHTKMADMLREY